MLRACICIFIVGFAVSCRTARPVSIGTGNQPRGNSRATARVNESIKAGKGAGASKRVYKRTSPFVAENAEAMALRSPYLNYTVDIESCNWIQFKYALIADVPVEAMSNVNLLNYMDEWYGVPYRYGGATKDGVDCSAFSAGLLTGVFGTDIPRTVREQYQTCRHIDKSELQEGDLVFFNTTGSISHVGIYLVNNKFVHASTSAGVTISDLNDAYYSRNYAGAGRVR